MVRRSRLCCALWAGVLLGALLAPAGAQSGLLPVSDAKGLFSISLPADWEAASSPMSEAVFRGLYTSKIGSSVVSTLAARSLGNNAAPGVLAVAAIDVPSRVSPALFGTTLEGRLPSNWKMTQGGRATIAGRDAYYAYFVLGERDYSLYMVMAYFLVGRTGFLVAGGTVNEPASIQRHFTAISRILETFRPSSKLGASPTPRIR